MLQRNGGKVEERSSLLRRCIIAMACAVLMSPSEWRSAIQGLRPGALSLRLYELCVQ